LAPTNFIGPVAMVTATVILQVAGLFRRFGMQHTVDLALMLWLMV
jgi:hypothetical protein